MPCDRAIDLQFPGQPIWAQRVYEIPASVPSTELNPTLRSVDTHGPVFLSLMNKSLCVLTLTAYRTVWILR